MNLPKTTEFIIVSGWVLMMACCLGLVGIDVYLLYLGQRVPEIADFAKLAMGFVFGSLPSVIVSLLTQKAPAPAKP